LVILLLFGDVLLLALVLLTLLAFLTILSLLLDVSVVLLWRSWLEVLLVVVVLVTTLILVLSSMRSVVVLHLVVVPLLTLHWLLRNEKLWLVSKVKALKLSLHGNWSWAEILVWVESSKGSHFSEAGNLDEGWWLWVQWAELEWTDGSARVVGVGRVIVVLLVGVATVVVVVSALVATSDLFRHWWKSDSFWEVWKRVDKLSPFLFVVIERASFTEWALVLLLQVFAWLSLVVRVNGTKSGLSEVRWKCVTWLSELDVTMSKLAVLMEWAATVFQVVLAELGLILLLQSVDLALVAVEAIIV